MAHNTRIIDATIWRGNYDVTTALWFKDSRNVKCFLRLVESESKRWQARQVNNMLITGACCAHMKEVLLPSARYPI